ncbi:MAG: non-ribosomal peptide synthetase, partial [Thermoleophilia bacterium]|nr:non-ribosomal peptide synthetase [Thermoleophilia bacterium]
ARSLNPDQPVFGLQARGLDGEDPPLFRIEEMAAEYINEITLLQPRGPYALCGYSFGGLLAFEMARQLVGQGEAVGLLALLDTFLVRVSPRGRLEKLEASVRYHARSLLTLPPREKVSHLRQSVNNVKRRIRCRCRRELLDGQQPTSGSLPDAQRRVLESNHIAARDYVAQPYPGKVTLFVVDHQADGLGNPGEQWKRLATGGVEAIAVPGTHLTMAADPHVGVLAQRLEECLSRASSDLPVAHRVTAR